MQYFPSSFARHGLRGLLGGLLDRVLWRRSGTKSKRAEIHSEFAAPDFSCEGVQRLFRSSSHRGRPRRRLNGYWGSNCSNSCNDANGNECSGNGVCVDGIYGSASDAPSQHRYH